MGQVNIYRIDAEKQEAFLQCMQEKMVQVNTLFRTIEVEDAEIEFGCTLYKSPEPAEKQIAWNWILREFGQEEVHCLPAPKAILLIEKDDEMYVATFGFSYFIVDKFCDRNFAFNFARKITYKEIKTTALSSPHSKRNKTVNTYVNYDELEFDSGESFTKIKAKALIPDDFTIYNESIEIGNSIKFSAPEDSVDSILKIIIHIEDVIANTEDKYLIPVFTKVSDKELLGELDERLNTEVSQNPQSINISELDIIGATEVFNHNDTSFTLKFGHFEKEIPELNFEQLKLFSEDKGFDLNSNLLKIKVVSNNNGNPVRSDEVRNLIDYTDDLHRCILSKGSWYQFNDDYVNYLSDSIAEIETLYDANFDFRKSQHEAFIERKYQEEKDNPVFLGMAEKQVRNKITNKYYAERAFNTIMQEQFGFSNFDRVDSRIGTADIELMDLYKDATMYAVKIGKTSSKLCYAVDQSLSSLNAYKHHLLEGMPEIQNVAVWLILEREQHLTVIDGKPNLNELNMIMLKNKLDDWKKEVRLCGYKPIIYINYVVRDGEPHAD